MTAAAGGIPCNADFVSKQHDKRMADYEKLKREDANLEACINVVDTAPGYHTKDNREKRNQLGITVTVLDCTP